RVPPEAERRRLGPAGPGLGGAMRTTLARGTARVLGTLPWVAIVLVARGSLPVGAQTASSASPWRTLAPMPTAGPELSAAVLDGKVFVLAGYDEKGASTATVEVYDPRTDSWRSAAPLPVATNHNAAATLGGRLYAFGGTTLRVFVYDSARD